MAERSPVKRLMDVRLILFPQQFVMSEFDNEEIRYQSTFIANKQVLWQSRSMHRTENPVKKVRILWAPPLF